MRDVLAPEAGLHADAPPKPLGERLQQQPLCDADATQEPANSQHGVLLATDNSVEHSNHSASIQRRHGQVGLHAERRDQNSGPVCVHVVVLNARCLRQFRTFSGTDWRTPMYVGVIRGLLTDSETLDAATSALDAMYAAAFESGAAGAFHHHWCRSLGRCWWLAWEWTHDCLHGHITLRRFEDTTADQWTELLPRRAFPVPAAAWRLSPPCCLPPTLVSTTQKSLRLAPYAVQWWTMNWTSGT